jgi:acrylyl-CoA reductase (NADPH)
LSLRKEAWSRLAKDLDLQKLSQMTQVIALDDVVTQAQALRSGQVKGRLVVKVS